VDRFPPRQVLKDAGRLIHDEGATKSTHETVAALRGTGRGEPIGFAALVSSQRKGEPHIRLRYGSLVQYVGWH